MKKTGGGIELRKREVSEEERARKKGKEIERREKKRGEEEKQMSEGEGKRRVKEGRREGIFRWKRDAKKDGRKSIFFFFFFELTPSSHEYTQLTESRLSWLGLSETHCFFREM